MIGNWTMAVAARILREETFALVFCPALADLQYEVSARQPLQRLKSRASLIAILTRALLHDVESDLMLAVSRDVRRESWR